MVRKMKILMVSYTDVNYDGRTRALFNVFSKIGNVKCFIRKGNNSKGMVTCDVSYPRFIFEVLKYAKTMKKIDILVLDNRKATVPGLLIKEFINPCFVIQDCRELYIFNEVKTISSKIGCIFEKKMSKIADIVICANKERAKIMKEIYSLSKLPITYENLRKLKYESNNALLEAKNKLDIHIHDDEVKIISSSGCSIERTNDILVKSLSNVQKKCCLFLVGKYTQAEKQAILKIAKDNKRDRVIILGQLNQTELKYLISKCDIGIVNYGQYDTNNRYCASGKLYEFIYEGMPVVTTTNPPLVRICQKYGIGISDDSYSNGINMVLNSYDTIRVRIKNYVESHAVEDNDQALINRIGKIINAKQGE